MGGCFVLHWKMLSVFASFGYLVLFFLFLSRRSILQEKEKKIIYIYIYDVFFLVNFTGKKKEIKIFIF